MKQDLLLDTYKAGERLPSEPQLAARLKAGRVTVRAALARLEKENLVLRYQGKGTFAVDRSKQDSHAGHYLLIYPDTADFTSSTVHILPGIEHYCAILNIKLTKIPLSIIRFAGHDRSLEILRQECCDGVILLAHCFKGNEPELGILHDMGLPVVLPHTPVTNDAKVTGFATLYYQIREGVEEAVRYQVSAGLDRFATFYYRGSEEKQDVFNYEREAYLSMLKRCGADPSPELLCRVDAADLLGIEKELLKILREKDIRSVFCYSDFCALGIYQVCARHGIRIPADLTVMGFCGFPGGQLLAPSLSTIDLQYENIGHMAVECLRHSEDWFGREVPCIPTPHKLVVGGSTAHEKV